MARYRQLHTAFWTDAFVEDMTPEQKLFYIYLLTNSRTTQCGIYEITKRTISNETGYTLQRVCELIEYFESIAKIFYNEKNREMFIANWIRYNWIDSKPVRLCIAKEIEKVKTQEFINEFDTLLIPYGYRIDTLTLTKKERMHTVGRDLGEEEKKKKKEEEKEREISERFRNIEKIQAELPY